MANPFAVTPANPLQALMAFDQSYQGARKRAREDELRDVRTEAGQIYAQGGDTRGVLGRLIGLGDATTVAALNKDSGSTDELKEYKFDAGQLQAAGKPVPTFGDWKASLRRAGATNVNVSTGDKTYDTELAKVQAKRFGDLQSGSSSAAKRLATFDRMEQLIDDPDFYSGAGAEKFVLPLKQAVGALGGDPNAGASMEAFRSLSSKAISDAVDGKLGAGISNSDIALITSQQPNLGNTPTGNKLMIQIGRAIAKREQEIFKLARQYAAKSGGRLDAGFDEFLADWAEKNPLFPRNAAPAPQQGGGVRRKWTPETGIR